MEEVAGWSVMILINIIAFIVIVLTLAIKSVKQRAWIAFAGVVILTIAANITWQFNNVKWWYALREHIRMNELLLVSAPIDQSAKSNLILMVRGSLPVGFNVPESRGYELYTAVEKAIAATNAAGDEKNHRQ